MAAVTVGAAGCGGDASTPDPPATGTAAAANDATSRPQLLSSSTALPAPPAGSAGDGPTLDCGTAIDTVATPPDEYTVLSGAVAVRTGGGTLQAERDPTVPADSPEAYFAKTGLLVRIGVASTLRLLDAEGQAVASWGRVAMPSTTIHIPACPARPSDGGKGDWLAFAGGYSVASPRCLTVVVTAPGGTDQAFATIPVGAPCPNQPA
ncbi:hypothetical protein [Frankia nepalensis]|uniref:Uncharacterized protein n=1 Tax=Frankia nepalensis TaxID=1836974 RepID=A0A937URP9_9ACTN|nr:hypothetical protein [Frankia nepalensis]MBL7497738.1 hypothetical protein [Frankia nepalensis]MBL7509733.1 hypothetical protein [Frankia nepalensis]MBL7629460.1 hypothetical protein [Frankia nepalensis]